MLSTPPILFSSQSASEEKEQGEESSYLTTPEYSVLFLDHFFFFNILCLCKVSSWWILGFVNAFLILLFISLGIGG